MLGHDCGEKVQVVVLSLPVSVPPKSCPGCPHNGMRLSADKVSPLRKTGRDSPGTSMVQSYGSYFTTADSLLLHTVAHGKCLPSCLTLRELNRRLCAIRLLV